MKAKWLLLPVLLLASPAFAQLTQQDINNCDAVVVDDAGVMGAKSADVLKAAQPLMNEGADIRVVTVEHSQNLDFTEKAFEMNCKSWQSTDGKLKNTMIVLMNAPKDHKAGIYFNKYGAWHNALDNSWNAIKSDYMVPHFKDGDFAGGFIAALQQIDKRIAASKDEAMHPVVAQTTNIVQPTDYSGLWTFLLWLGIALFGVAVFTGIYAIITRKKKLLEDVGGAQQKAQLTKASVSNRIRRAQAAIDGQKAIGNSQAIEWDKHMGLITERYADLAGQERTDPSQPNLSESEYENLTTLYEAVGADLAELEQEMIASEHHPDNHPIAEALGFNRATPAPQHHYRTTRPRVDSDRIRASQETTHTEHTNTVIPIPIPIPYEREEREEPVETHHHSSDDDSSSSGGGSSSYGGSGDTGGGSSDYGGSGDSGGGSSDSGGGGGDSGGGSSDY